MYQKNLHRKMLSASALIILQRIKRTMLLVAIMLSVSVFSKGGDPASCPYMTSYVVLQGPTSFRVAFKFISPNSNGVKSIRCTVKSGNTTIIDTCFDASGSPGIERPDTTGFALNGSSLTISFTGFTGNTTCLGTTCTKSATFTPLAVKIVSFDAALRNNSVMLNWQVSEENIKSYVVERSFDGSNWSEIGNILPKNATYYSYSDNVDRSAYYRLKLVEEDGSFSYSQTAMVKIAGPKVNLYPNPVTDVLHLSSSTDYILYDLQGKQLLKGTGNSIQMDVPPGTYFLKIDDNVQTVIKQ